MAKLHIALLFLGLIGNVAGVRLKQKAKKKSADVESVEIRSTIKLRWPSEFTSAKIAESASLLERELEASVAPLFDEAACRQMREAASALKKTDETEYMAICKAYEEVELASTGIDLTGVAKVATHKNGTTLPTSFKMYVNPVLTGIITQFLEEHEVEGTIGGHTYAEVIRALLDSGIKVYLIGGLVRDMSRGLPANDVDLGFTGTANQVTEAIRKTLGMSVFSYVPGNPATNPLLTIPGGDYFAFGKGEEKIEGKNMNFNVLGHSFAQDFSMNTVAYDMQCLSRQAAATCYVVDKTGVGLRHSLSGTMDLPLPGGSEHYDATDFNDWFSSQCGKIHSRKPCEGPWRFWKFVARGWAPTPQFRDLIVPSLRVLLKFADYDLDFADFHAKRKANGLPPLFVRRHTLFPEYKLIEQESEYEEMAPNIPAGAFSFFLHTAKSTRLATMQEAAKMAHGYNRLLQETPGGICDSLPEYCVPANEMFPSIIAWSQGFHTGAHVYGAGKFWVHPCGERATWNTERAEWDTRLAGKWYSWAQGRYWNPSSASDALDAALLAEGACPEEVPMGDSSFAMNWANLKKNRDMCYIPTSGSDKVFAKLLTCR